MEYPSQNLANAIVEMAARDYKNSLIRLKRHPDDLRAAGHKRECERFFHSRWYSMLTSVDPEYIMERIRKEV